MTPLQLATASNRMLPILNAGKEV